MHSARQRKTIRRAGRWAVRLAVLSVGATLTLASPAHAQQLRAWDHGPYGRLVFDWEGPEPTVQLSNLGDRAVISSSRAIERDVDWILQYLGDYISDVEMRDGGRTVVLYLTGPMRIDRLAFNDRAAFDFRRDPDGPAPATVTTPPPPPEVPLEAPPEVPSSPDVAIAADPPAPQTPPMDEAAGQQAVAAVGQRPLPEPNLDISALPPQQRPPVDTSEPTPASGTQTGDSQADESQPGSVAGPAIDLPRLGQPIAVQAVGRLGYSRVVFDLPQEIDYSVSNEGDLVAIMFDAIAEADLAAIDPAALPEVSGAVQETVQEGLVVAIGIRPDVQVRDFIYGGRLVIDLLAPPRGYVGEIAPVPVAGDIGPANPAVADSDADSSAQAPTQSEPASADDTSSTNLAETLQGADAPDPAADDGGAATDQPAAPDTPDEDEMAQADQAGPVPEASPADPVDQAAMPRTATFDIGVPMAMAAFVRGESLWLVFAGEGVTAGALANQGELGFGPSNVAEARGGVALRFADMGDRRPEIARSGTAWTVSVPASQDMAADPLTIERQPDHADGARLLIPADGAVGPVAFIDPAVGDILVAMPVTAAGQGVSEIIRFVQFRLLPTAQGVVIRPAADDLRVRAVDAGIEVTAEGGLQLF